MNAWPSSVASASPSAAVSASTADLELRVLEGFAAFAALAGEWDELLGRCEADQPFSRHAWFTTWWQSFGEGRPCQVVTVCRAGRLVAALPLLTHTVCRYGHDFRQLGLWVNTHSFRSGLVCDREHLDAVGVLVAHLAARRDWDLLELPYLPRDWQVQRAFRSALSAHGLPYLTRPGMDSPRLALQGSWEDYLQSRSRSRRETIRRKLRRLDKAGAVISISRGRVADLEQRLQDCWEVSRHTWKHREGSSIAADPRRMAFYRALAELDPDWLVLGLVHREGRPIAFEYDLLHGGILYNLKLGYDEAEKELAPGQALRYAMLEWAFVNGVRMFDYMGLSAEYKLELSSEVLYHENLRVYSRSLAARLAHLYEARLRPALSRVKRRLHGGRV
ncbi:MAG TPA: GNAT family N-acetyltransferase [Candidatus Competibacteraceae bacterium]|nr:GNAT family N-acetyltransferase [Candidatus Competibacteraceae bacterium]